MKNIEFNGSLEEIKQRMDEMLNHLKVIATDQFLVFCDEIF